MNDTLISLTLILGIASIVAILFRVIKQPPILAYLLTGILIGTFAMIPEASKESLKSLSDLGITLLLFLLGLELKIGELKSVGKVAIITGVGQILITTGVGFLITTFIGFDTVSAFYISFALTFSSTIMIVKLLSDKKDLNSLYGKIAVGMLLVQDFCAITALVLLSGFSNGNALQLADIFGVVLKAALLFGVVILLSTYVVPYVLRIISRSSEILFLSSLAWAFAISALVASPLIGFSIEIGGFLAGLALANSLETTQIVAKVKTLRDFFIVIFFVTLGMSFSISNLGDNLLPAILLSIFIIFGNPIIVISILGALGYRTRTSFMTGLTVAQISEFSIIVVFLGVKLGHVTESVLSMVTLIGIITFMTSGYLIQNGERVYKFFKPILGVFEKKKTIESKYNGVKNLADHIVIVGMHRMGEGMLEGLKGSEKDVVVIDFNPDVVEKLKSDGFEVVFGDIADPEIHEKSGLMEASIIISTVPDFHDNIILCEALKNRDKKTLLMVTAHSIADQKDLYKAGADYVLMPYMIAGRSIGKLILNGEIQNLKM